MKEAIAQLRKAWESHQRDDPATEATRDAAMAYAHVLLAAELSGVLTRNEVGAALDEIGDWAKSRLPPGIGPLVEHLASSGMSMEGVMRVLRQVAEGDGEPFRVISVDSDGVASVVELTPDHPADGIGRPIGNA